MDISKHEVTAPKYRLNIKDFLKGLFMAAGTAAIFIVQAQLDAGNFNIDWKRAGMGAIAGAVTYLVKNYFSPAVVKVPISDIDAEKMKDSGEPTTSK